jgi:hypothetical protein
MLHLSLQPTTSLPLAPRTDASASGSAFCRVEVLSVTPIRMVVTWMHVTIQRSHIHLILERR